ncbi:kinase [soil metagenome]
MSSEPSPLAARIVEAVLPRLKARSRLPFVLGLCGAQGSGKSTVCVELEYRLRAAGFRAATLSLDDLYLPAQDRAHLALTVHPLLRTRGVPGTHDVALGLRVIDRLGQVAATPLPRFDKARDMRRAQEDWPVVDGPVDLLLFEGWCVGAMPQADDALIDPVNDLERTEDCDGAWRRAVNDALGGAYQALFGRIDMVVLLAAPDFGVVRGWRAQQEHDLRRRMLVLGEPILGVMSDQAIARFVQHYERLTRHILAEMPMRAEMTVQLDADRRMIY